MNIAPYTPLPVWVRTASRWACAAAAAGSPGWVQPWTSARISAPIHSRNGLRWRAVSGGSMPVEQIAVRDALGGEGPARGELVEPQPGDVGGGEAVAVPLEQQQVSRG